jgi:hypothetical protein
MKRGPPIAAKYPCFKRTRLFLWGGSFGPASFAPARQIIWGVYERCLAQGFDFDWDRTWACAAGCAPWDARQQDHSLMYSEAEQVHCFLCFWQYLCNPWWAKIRSNYQRQCLTVFPLHSMFVFYVFSISSGQVGVSMINSSLVGQ